MYNLNGLHVREDHKNQIPASHEKNPGGRDGLGLASLCERIRNNMLASKNTTTKKEKSKDEAKLQDKLKNPRNISTPRDFIQKSSLTDIFGPKKKTNTQPGNAPRKVPGTSTNSNISPMRGLLKSSDSSVSQISTKSTARKVEIKKKENQMAPKKLSFTNVTVNSPVNKRKEPKEAMNKSKESESRSKEIKETINKSKSRQSEIRIKELKDDTDRIKSKESEGRNQRLKEKEKDLIKKETTKDGNKEKSNNYEVTKEKIKNTSASQSSKSDLQYTGQRQRTKTRTLDNSEVKILTPEVLDNNVEMMNLTKKLIGKPKVFYIDLDKEKPTPKQDKSSDEEVSYEDDFESYESDFDSYHSERTDASDAIGESNASESGENEASEAKGEVRRFKEAKDEEKMLDSGNFDLRDRSAKSKPAIMDFIKEDEEKKTVSLTDEGFQEMSSSSAVSSIKTTELISVDRPLIDFTASKRNKIRRKINERLTQRAKDLLSMIKLHEMSYSLFEMQPISYDLYMATFGRNNHTQVATQTFEDGITQEVQTDEVITEQKWTQYPVEFSKNILLNQKKERKYSKITEDYLTKFTFMIKNVEIDDNENEINSDESYVSNPLRIYLEQKDGTGGDQILPYEIYKSKLKNTDYNAGKLSKFIKKYESVISNTLSLNSGNKELVDLLRSPKLSFSNGYSIISPLTIQNDKYSFLKQSQIVRVLFSETKSNLVLTIHKNATFIEDRKSIVCLWDLSVAREPLKILTAIDDVVIGRFIGNTDGIFTAVLEDGSIHLWDLSEDPTYRKGAARDKPTKLVEVIERKEGLTQTESDREWNLKNRHVGFKEPQLNLALQSSAYTNSAKNMEDKDLDNIVGLEIIVEAASLDGGKKIIGQIVSLQRSGIITMWSILQEKRIIQDIGKAFWSKIKLQKYQTIKLNEHIDLLSREINNNFNLSAAKRRISHKKQEITPAKLISRPKSAILNFDFDIDRPSSAASLRKKVLSVEINLPENWETGLLCNDLKVLKYNNLNCFLVAKNCGEVLCCKRCLGVVKVERFCVSSDTSTVTCIEVSRDLPQFLAATDNGTVNICSLLDNRVLLTLDCRNTPPSTDIVDKCVSDHKGRFISSSTTKQTNVETEPFNKLHIKSIHWSQANPCTIHILLLDGTLKTFELTYSDIYTRHTSNKTTLDCAVRDNILAILTLDGEVQIHKLGEENRDNEFHKIFEKYVSLL